jgi:hypothetical protein
VAIDVQKVLVKDEDVLGRFQVEILAPSSDGWAPAVMAIETLVTNYRVLLKPFKKKYEPASIPNYFISAIEEDNLGGFPCLTICIKTGHSFHLVIPRRHKKSLYNSLLKMHIPKPKFKMDENVARDDIQRLVSFFER